MTRKPRPRVAKGPQPQLLASPFEDKLLRMIMTLATELAVVRERAETLAEACAKAGIDVAAMEDDASPERSAARAQRQREFAARLLQVLEDDSPGR
jgi:hypothetical protein